MRKEYITNVAWKKILKFLKQDPRVYKASKRSLRCFMEAIYWMARTGAQWRMLPREYGNWNSVFKKFRRWTKKGIWDDLMEFCIEDPDMEYVMIDSTIVRAHACAAGIGKQSFQGLGRSKGGFTSKIHAKVDALGNPLKFIVTPGQESDINCSFELLKMVANAFVLGDKGYDSDLLRKLLKSWDNIPVIPGRSNRKITVEYDKHIYKERSLIECFFSKMKYFRRVFSRFDKHVSSFLAFIKFVGAIIWLR